MNSVEMRINPRLPTPGDISCCGGCGAFSIFNGLLQLEKPDKLTMQTIENTPELMDMQARMLGRGSDLHKRQPPARGGRA